MVLLFYTTSEVYTKFGMVSHIACDEFFMLRIKNSSCAHSAAPRFRTGFASLDSGSDWSEPNAFASKMLTLSVSPQASDRLRQFYVPDAWEGAFVGKAKRLCKQNAETGQAKM